MTTKQNAADSLTAYARELRIEGAVEWNPQYLNGQYFLWDCAGHPLGHTVREARKQLRKYAAR